MTTTVDKQAQPANIAPLPASHRFTVDDYHRMVESGVLKEDDRVELLNGEIIDTAPLSSQHNAQVMKLADLFYQHRKPAIQIMVQSSIRLNREAEPEPDMVLLPEREDRYIDALPTAGDILLLVEVSSTTLAYDRSRKLPAYAQAGIREYWIVSLPDNQLEIYTDPQAGTYSTKRIAKRGETVTTDALPDVTLAVDDILL
jgi:Uma2 family endonuclease